LAIALRYAARSDVGLVRQNNQDSAYAGPHLLVVADGMGGHAGGDVASSLAVGELAPLDGESHGADDALEHLKQAVFAAHRELLTRVDEEPELTGMGTTVTALLRTGGKLALAHIGDSRAYLLRDGELIQITKDHTFVQTLVDDGRLTLEEAEQHPQRSVLMRVLSDVIDDVEPDLSMREGRPEDRYLLCSDGLSGVVSHDTLRDTLASGADPASTCEALVQLALRAGAPDNVTCIIADVVDSSATQPETNPSVVGAAALVQRSRATVGAPSAAERAAALTAPVPTALDGDTQPIPLVDTDGETLAPQVRHRHRTARLVGGLVVLAVLVAGGYTAWRWVMQQYFVGQKGGFVAVYHGLPDDVGPVTLSRVDSLVEDIPLADLPAYDRERVSRGIVADTEQQAWTIVDSLGRRAAACRLAAAPTPSVTASPSATASLTATGTPTTGTATTGTATTGAPATGVPADGSSGAAAAVATTAPKAGATPTPGTPTAAAPTPSLTETDPVALPTSAGTSAGTTGDPAAPGAGCGDSAS
jgi:protein phosphatase